MSNFEIYRGEDKGEQCWRWRLIDSNGDNIAKSEEPFLKNSIKRSIKTIQERVTINTPLFLDESPEDTDTGYRFEYFQSKNDKEWYWRLKAGNNENIAIGGQGFKAEDIVKQNIEQVKAVIINNAAIVFQNPEDVTAEPSNEGQTPENPSTPSGA